MADVPSTRPYLIRALHQWCEDNGVTPYIVVSVDESVQVPAHVVSPQGEVVLNISHAATAGLRLGNDYVEFQARFGGVPHPVSVPVGRITAIYARENGQGMAFPVESTPTPPAPSAPPSPASEARPGRPALKRIK